MESTSHLYWLTREGSLRSNVDMGEGRPAVSFFFPASGRGACRLAVYYTFYFISLIEHLLTQRLRCTVYHIRDDCQQEPRKQTRLIDVIESPNMGARLQIISGNGLNTRLANEPCAMHPLAQRGRPRQKTSDDL